VTTKQLTERDEQRVAGWISCMVGTQARADMPTEGHREGWDAATARNEGHTRGCACDRCNYRGSASMHPGVALVTVAAMAKKKKRGPGRPALEGDVLFVRGVTEDVGKVLDEIDARFALGGRAATVRALLSALRDEDRVRGAFVRTLLERA
jgi:hypothetical protein